MYLDGDFAMCSDVVDFVYLDVGAEWIHLNGVALVYLEVVGFVWLYLDVVLAE